MSRLQARATFRSMLETCYRCTFVSPGTCTQRRVGPLVETVMMFVNHPTKVEADLPFGGVRPSGYGRELIGLGLKEFANHKLIVMVDIDAPF